MRLLFIAGLGRSGSTLIERMLAELPGVHALGATICAWADRPDHPERCGCGQPLSGCGFWTAVGEKAFGGWHNVDREHVAELVRAVSYTREIPALLRPDRRRLAVVTEFLDHHTRIYAAATAITGARVLVDSSKYPALLFSLRRAARELDLRVLHLVRDPRGVAYSWTRQVPRPETYGTTLAPRHRPIYSAMRWSAQNAAVEVFARMGRDDRRHDPVRVPVQRIRYEDFLADPTEVIRSIASFAGIDLVPTDLDYVGPGHVNLGPAHTAAGNRVRFAVGRIPLVRDDEWHTGFPPAQRRLVSAICAPAITAYGYPLLTRPRQRR